MFGISIDERKRNRKRERDTSIIRKGLKKREKKGENKRTAVGTVSAQSADIHLGSKGWGKWVSDTPRGGVGGCSGLGFGEGSAPSVVHCAFEWGLDLFWRTHHTKHDHRSMRVVPLCP